MTKQPTILPKAFLTFRQFNAKFPAQIASTFYFSQPHMPSPQKIKRACNPSHGLSADIVQNITPLCIDQRRRASYNT